MRRVFIGFCLFCLQDPTISFGQSQALEGIHNRHGLAGISVVTRCGGSISTEYHAGYSRIDLELPVDSNTAFRVASISKAATALATAKLHAQGHLDVDAPLEDYLSFTIRHPQFPEQPLTLRMLLSHTAGIRDGAGYGPFVSETYAQAPSVPEMSALLNPSGYHFTDDMWGRQAPGTYFHYSNLNFGLAATVLEAATGMRFDQLMVSLLLEPYGLDGGFQPEDLSSAAALATLYRQDAGQWVPQADDISAPRSKPPLWAGYSIGTNAIGFSPQGGLRISARSLTVLAQLWSRGFAQSPDGLLAFLGPDDLTLLQEPQWKYNGSNGDTYHGLFNQWTTGLHMASSGLGDDTLIPGVGVGPLLGHPGEAYGLISDTYATPDGRWSMAFVTNGKWNGYEAGTTSAFYKLEEEVFGALQADLSQCLTREKPDLERPSWSASSAPEAGDTLLFLKGNAIDSGPVSVNWNGPDRNALLGCVAKSMSGGWWRLNLPPLSPGVHRIEITSGAHPQRIPLLVWVAP